MNDLLFDTPWWLPTSIILAGIGLFVVGNRRQRSGVRNAGAALVLVGILNATVSYLVETPKELCSRETRRMIHAVEQKDWPTLNRLLDTNSSLGTVLGTIFSNREQLIAGAKSSVDRWQLQTVFVTSLSATQDESAVTVDADLLSTQDATGGRPVTSSWMFEWQQSGGGWQLRRITCLQIGDQAVSQLPGLIGR